jgi:hypothetical protein
MNLLNKYISLPVLLSVSFYLTGGNQAVKAEQKMTVPIPQEESKLNPVQLIITKHLQAIRERNADKAYSHISHALHEKFNDAGKFLVSLRLEYRPIYNYKEYVFLEQRHGKNGNITQTIQIEDDYGHVALVIYNIKEEKGDFLIDSFTVINDEAQPI